MYLHCNAREEIVLEDTPTKKVKNKCYWNNLTNRFNRVRSDHHKNKVSLRVFSLKFYGLWQLYTTIILTKLASLDFSLQVQ